MEIFGQLEQAIRSNQEQLRQAQAEAQAAQAEAAGLRLRVEELESLVLELEAQLRAAREQQGQAAGAAREQSELCASRDEWAAHALAKGKESNQLRQALEAQGQQLEAQRQALETAQQDAEQLRQEQGRWRQALGALGQVVGLQVQPRDPARQRPALQEPAPAARAAEQPRPAAATAAPAMEPISGDSTGQQQQASSGGMGRQQQRQQQQQQCGDREGEPCRTWQVGPGRGYKRADDRTTESFRLWRKDPKCLRACALACVADGMAGEENNPQSWEQFLAWPYDSSKVNKYGKFMKKYVPRHFNLSAASEGYVFEEEPLDYVAAKVPLFAPIKRNHPRAGPLSHQAFAGTTQQWLEALAGAGDRATLAGDSATIAWLAGREPAAAWREYLAALPNGAALIALETWPEAAEGEAGVKAEAAEQ